MKGDKIRYYTSYKYILAENYSVQTPLRPENEIITEFIELTKTGLLTIKKRYAWDGCSGPTFDDKTNMRGGLIHDALYQLMRLGLLFQENRIVADNILRNTCLEDGMSSFRAWYYFEGVDHFATSVARFGSDPYPILTAP
jgi:hypothetical protein